MPIAHTPAGPVFFAHVPKTGGTSVEDYLARRFGRLSLIDVNKRTHIRGTGLITPATHLAAVDLAELLPPDLALGFAVVRDPLQRLQSEFRYQTGASRMSRLGFSTWLRVVLGAAAREPRLYENHVRPQSDLVPEGAEVFRLEDGFQALITRLDAVTGTSRPDLEIGHMNVRPRAPLPLSREDSALIAKFYAPDFARFGYAPPRPADHPPDRAAGLRGALARPLSRALVTKQRYDWAR